MILEELREAIYNQPGKALSIFYPLLSDIKVEESAFKERLESVVSQAKMFRKLDVPVDIFMCVGFGVTPSQTKELCENLSRYNVKAGMYVAPLLNLGTEIEKEARRKGYVLKNKMVPLTRFHLASRSLLVKG